MEKNNQTPKKVKCIVDIIMLLLLLLCMVYQVTGNLWHEIIGIGMFVVFVIHCVLNRNWFTHFSAVVKGTKHNLANKICSKIY